MPNILAVEALLLKRQQLLDERTKAVSRFDQEISSLDTALEILSGKKVWELKAETLYDDERPDYIKASEEEI